MAKTGKREFLGVDSSILCLDALAFAKGGARLAAHDMLAELKCRDENMVDEVLSNLDAKERNYFRKSLRML